MANPMLMNYVKLTEFLGQALGPDYEVALHDLTDKNRPIIAIANNHVSGREMGAPLTNGALKILMDRGYETQDYQLHGLVVSRKGKTLRSSAMFIKQNGKPVGMLSITFDDSRYIAVSQDILELCHPDKFLAEHFTSKDEAKADTPSAEQFHDSVRSVAEEAVARALAELGVSADRLTLNERLQIIAELSMNGIFLLKGAVKDVADALNCSQASVYRYLSQLRREENGGLP